MDHIFIGRADELKRLRRDVFRVPADSQGMCYSLIGPNNIGKTYLIRQLAKELEENPIPNVYYFQTVIYDQASYWDFWISLIGQFAFTIDQEALYKAPHPNPRLIQTILDAYDFFTDPLNTVKKNTDEFKQIANAYLEALFPRYKSLGIRIIITIDEFDRAREIFTDGDFFQRLYSLTPKGGFDFLLSVITISRRSVGTIAHHMRDGSDLESAFPSLPLRGFSNEELDDYFETFRSLPCKVPDRKAQQEILYLCGRSPGLLMKMRHEMSLLEEEDPVNVGKIYSESGKFFRDAYARMCQLMRTEYADAQKNQDCMEVFVQKFIGPAYTSNLPEKVETLFSHGFVTKADTKNSIYVRAGLELPDEEGRPIYEPMSPYFVQYVKNSHIPDATEMLSDLLEETELTVRKTLLSQIKQWYPQTWQQVLDAYAQKKDSYLDTLLTVAMNNDCSERGIEVSRLDIMSFNDYFDIIEDHWAQMEPFFPGQSRVSVERTFRLLNANRNSSAHLNLEILNDENRKRLKTECETLIRCLSGNQSAPAPVPVPNPGSEVPPSRPKAELYDEPDGNWVGRTVPMKIQEKTMRNSLRGVIEGTEYRISISPKHLKKLLFEEHRTPSDLDALVGRTVDVRVSAWDPQGSFNGEWDTLPR